MSIDQESFKKALSRWASGVTVITTCTKEGAPVGFTASSFASLSLDPPLVLFCIGNASSRIKAFNEADLFGVNILSSDQGELSNHFAGREEGLFENSSHHLGKLGMPLLHGAIARLECRVTQRIPGGDHLIVMGEVQTVALEDEYPLIYFRGGYFELKQD